MKKKFLTFALMICFIMPCAILLSACGKESKPQYTIKAEVTEHNDIWTNIYQDEDYRMAGEDFEIEVYFAGGYLPQYLVVNINGTNVQNDGILTYDDGTVIDGEPDCTKTIIWKYTIQNINADQTINIDPSACQVGNITVTLNSTLNTNVKSYSTLKQTEGLVTSLVQGENMENVLSISNNKFQVPYGSDVILFLDKDIERVNYSYTTLGVDTNTSTGALSIYNEKYLQGGALSVFKIDDVTNHLRIDSLDEEIVVDYSAEMYDLENNNIFSVMVPEYMGAVSAYPYSDSVSYVSSDIYPSEEVLGITLKSIDYYHEDRAHMYLGSEINASADSSVGNNVYIYGHDKSAFTNNLYFKFTVGELFDISDFNFYLVEDKNSVPGNTDKVTDKLIGISQDGKSAYIKLTVEDVERFLSWKDTDGDEVNDTYSGGAFLRVLLKTTAITQKSLMQIDVSTSINGLSTLYNPLSDVGYSFVVDKPDVTSYYVGTLTDEPTITLGAGISSFDDDKTSNRYTDAKVIVYDTTSGYQQIAEYPVEFLSTDLNEKIVELPILTTTESKNIKIIVQYTKQAYDKTSHAISFEHFDFAGEKLFIKTSLDADWVEVNASTNNITISSGEKLYFYYEGSGIDEVDIVYNYEPEYGGTVISYSSSFSDLLGNDFDTADNSEYFIEICDTYLNAGETIYMRK